MIELLLEPGAFAIALAFGATALIMWLAPRLGVVDDPNRRHCPAALHERPVPRGGGMALWLAVALGAWWFLPHDRTTACIVGGGAIIVLVGWLDDRGFDIHPYTRLMSQIAAAACVVGAGLTIDNLSNPFGATIDLHAHNPAFQLGGRTVSVAIVPGLLAVLWIVALMNATSWSSGVDGQVSGLVAIAALVIGVESFTASATTPAGMTAVTLAGLTAGAYLGFLPWHVYPQRIMPGFGGGTLGGFLLAVLAMMGTVKLGAMMVVMAIPIADAAYAVVRRCARGRNPIWGDGSHLHHRLLALGCSRRQTAQLYWIATALLGAIVLTVEDRRVALASSVALVVAGAVVLWVKEAAAWRAPAMPTSGERTAEDARAVDAAPGNPRNGQPTPLWPASTRAAIIADVLETDLSVDDACRKYGLTRDRLEEWMGQYCAFRNNPLGLRILCEQLGAQHDPRAANGERNGHVAALLRLTNGERAKRARRTTTPRPLAGQPNALTSRSGG